MTELTQQVLVEPEPARVVKAEPGSSWWGVDPSTKRVSIGASLRDARHVDTRSFTSSAGPRRLGLIYAETWHFTNVMAEHFWPGFVLVEQPSGKAPNPNLLYAVGVIQAAVYSALARLAQRDGFPWPVVETVPSATWKSLAIGPGWAKLDKAAGDILRLAREDGYDGDSLDEADAWFIAKAARRTVRFS